MLVRIIGEDKAEKLYQGWRDTHYDSVYRDSKMSVEKFDDLMAALTFTATVLTITLGLLFSL